MPVLGPLTSPSKWPLERKPQNHVHCPTEGRGVRTSCLVVLLLLLVLTFESKSQTHPRPNRTALRAHFSQSPDSTRKSGRRSWFVSSLNVNNVPGAASAPSKETRAYLHCQPDCAFSSKMLGGPVLHLFDSPPTASTILEA